jgi:hypothetical protein
MASGADTWGQHKGACSAGLGVHCGHTWQKASAARAQPLRCHQGALQYIWRTMQLLVSGGAANVQCQHVCDNCRWHVFTVMVGRAHRLQLKVQLHVVALGLRPSRVHQP